MEGGNYGKDKAVRGVRMHTAVAGWSGGDVV